MLSSGQVDSLIDEVIEREGGYVNDPDDPGGETKYGISKRAHPNVDIRNLTVIGAREIYRAHYVKPYRIAEIDNYRVAGWVLDWVVHSGGLAVKHIQRQLGLPADGILGPQTERKLEELKDPEDILRWRLKFLVKLTKHKYIGGWVNRLIELGL